MWKASSGGPYIPSTRLSLSITWRSLSSSAICAWLRPESPAVDAVERGVAAMRRDQRDVVGLAHQAHGGERVVDALVGEVAAALDDDPQGLVGAAPGAGRGGERKTSLAIPLRT